MFDDVTRDHEGKGSSDRSFGMVFTVVFALIGVWPLVGHWTDLDSVRRWALGVALAIFLIALIRPVLLAPVNILWMKFGLLLNKIMSPLIIGLLFFIVLTPVAVVMRLSGKDSLGLKRSGDEETCWVTRDDEIPVSMDNQF